MWEVSKALSCAIRVPATKFSVNNGLCDEISLSHVVSSTFSVLSNFVQFIERLIFYFSFEVRRENFLLAKFWLYFQASFVNEGVIILYDFSCLDMSKFTPLHFDFFCKLRSSYASFCQTNLIKYVLIPKLAMETISVPSNFNSKLCSQHSILIETQRCTFH